MTRYEDLAAILDRDVWPADPDECVDWQFGKSGNGYGCVWNDSTLRSVHRVSYCLAKRIPLDDIDGLVIRHSCNNPSCLRPGHLASGTQKDNMDDMNAQGRHHEANVTHCPAGHAYSVANTRVASTGCRHCRTCGRLWKAAERAGWTSDRYAAEYAAQRAQRARRTPEQRAKRNVAERARRRRKTDAVAGVLT